MTFPFLKRLNLAFLFIGILLIFGMAKNLEAGDFFRIGEDFRSLAMGNTGISSANNSSALFYNPAALSNVFAWWFDFPMVQVVYSDDAQALYETLRNGLDLETQEDQFEFMEDNIGKNPYIQVNAGLNALANLDKRGLTIGGNYTYELIADIEVRNASAPEIVAYERLDNIAQIGMSYPIGLGQLVLGLGYKRIARQELSFTYDINSALNEETFPTLQDDATKATGSAFDVGFIYRTATAAHISLGAVYRNKVSFNKDGVTDIPTQLDLGMSMRQDGTTLRWILACDIRDVTRQLGSEDKESGEKSWYRRLHAGTELGIFPFDKTSSIFSLRAGYNSGYLTYGAEIALGRYMIIGYTKYSEEIGEYAGQKESPRTVYYLSFGY